MQAILTEREKLLVSWLLLATSALYDRKGYDMCNTLYRLLAQRGIRVENIAPEPPK